VSDWLRSLPHQIPFRAACSATQIDARTIEGWYLVSANDALSEGAVLSQTLVFEAMAQIGGTLAFQNDPRPGFLSAIDRATLAAPIVVGDQLLLRVTLDAEFGGVFRFSGSAQRDGVELASARFYLASQPQEP
jgi:3-hydroxymyristoyl/3-hydroxydecanoyl-(acyl carrier protein) dehydratase